MLRIAVVGGGITGLATAYFLEQSAADIAIDLFDADRRLGGKISTDNSHNVIIEGGPDSFLAAKPAMVELCEALGLAPRLIGVNPAARGSDIFWRGRFYPIPQGMQAGVPARARPLLANRLLSPAGKLALLRDLVVRKGPPGDQSLGRFLRRHFGNQLVDRLAGPMLAGIYAGDVDQMSLTATFPSLLAAEQRAGSVYLGIRRSRPSPQSPSPRPRSAFLTLDHGLEQIVTVMAQTLSHTRVLLSTKVDRIEPTGRNWTLTFHGQDHSYDAVFVTTPAYAAADMLEFLPTDALDILRQIPYANLAVIGAAYSPEDVPIPTNRTGFLVPRESGLGMTAVTWVSSKWQYPGVASLFVLRAFYGRADENILQDVDEVMLARFRQEIAATMNIRRPARYQRIFRLPRSMPQYTVGHVERLQEFHRWLADYSHLYVLGAFEGGVGLPDRVLQARRTVQAFLGPTEMRTALPSGRR